MQEERLYGKIWDKAFQCEDREMDPEMGVKLVGQWTCGHSWGRGGGMIGKTGIDIDTLYV